MQCCCTSCCLLGVLKHAWLSVKRSAHWAQARLGEVFSGILCAIQACLHGDRRAAITTENSCFAQQGQSKRSFLVVFNVDRGCCQLSC